MVIRNILIYPRGESTYGRNAEGVEIGKRIYTTKDNKTNISITENVPNDFNNFICITYKYIL
jgi:hypothetical protein